MSTSPAPSAVRGDITLQPSYFTSSLYVNPLREDISDLISAFSQKYKEEKPTQPFACFKEIWKEQGWSWLHFKVFDSRARHSFISVTERLFLGRHSTYDTQLNSSLTLLQNEYLNQKIRSRELLVSSPCILSTTPSLQALRPVFTLQAIFRFLLVSHPFEHELPLMTYIYTPRRSLRKSARITCNLDRSGFKPSSAIR